MILTCPQCATRYLLPAHMLAPEGRRVKCSSCAEVWFQLPDSEEVASSGRPYDDIPEGVRPIPDGSNLPTISEEDTSGAGGRPRAIGYATAAAIFALVFAGLLSFQPAIVKKAPFTKPFYAMLGHQAPLIGAGLTFEGIQAQAEPDSAGEKISITGKIVNATANEEQLPMIEAQMRNEAGDVMERWIIRPPAPNVAAQGNVEFSTSYLSATPGAAFDINLQFIPVQD
jgi:predicted Zn finger-like uncharacterized protein